jgi:hypothetical protein
MVLPKHPPMLQISLFLTVDKTEVPKIIPTCSPAHARSIDIDDSYLYDVHPRSPSDLTTTMTAQQKCLDEHPKKLYVDLILEDGRIGERRRNGSSILKV